LSAALASAFVASIIEANGGAAFFESILASQHLCLFTKMLSKNAAPPCRSCYCYDLIRVLSPF
jgi:hypothetical protein